MMTEKEKRTFLEIERVFEQTGKAHLEFLGQCTEIQTISRIFVQHEITRRMKKRGEEDLFVKKFTAREKNTREVIRGLEVESEVTAIKIPDVEEDDMLIHGRIINERSQGIAGVTVALEDGDGNIIRPLTGKTTTSGYYSIVVSSDRVRTIPEEVFLNVTMVKGESLYLKPDPLKVKKGARLLIEVPLGNEDFRFIGGIRGTDPIEKNIGTVELKEIKGIGKIRAEKLRKVGITNLKKFSVANESTLKRVMKGVSITDIRTMKDTARTMLKKR